jgi:hypothetical protein
MQIAILEPALATPASEREIMDCSAELGFSKKIK